MSWLPAPAAAVEELPAAKIGRIEEAVASFMEAKGIPGLSLAVAVGDEVVWQRGFGKSDLENGIPATAATAYRIASVTKPVTAVAAMQLVEQGKLDLDAPVQKYAPTFPIKDFPVTTRQLLAHQGGIRNYRRGEGERISRYASLTEALSVFKDAPLESEPGTRYAYSTFGYVLLGVVVEGASGLSYPEYIRERIFKPAGMKHADVDDVYALIPHRARGYHPKVYAVFDGNVRNASLMDSSYKVPAGGIVATAEDMARFAIAVQNGTLIKPETFVQMSMPRKTRDGQETGYGYGWYVDGRTGRKPDGSVWHGGVQQGFTADLWILPERRFALAILTNLEGGGILGLATLANQIAEVVLTGP
jgi:CubicO group peptidase (beta-lactamase class C family)